MKKKDSFPKHHGHFLLLSEELRRVKTVLREAESFLESEMAMRDLERIIEGVENLENQSGA